MTSDLSNQELDKNEAFSRQSLEQGEPLPEIEYDDEGNELKPLKPSNEKEEFYIKELMRKYPELDYLMALCLVKATPEQLAMINNEKIKPTPMKTIVIKDAFEVQ